MSEARTEREKRFLSERYQLTRELECLCSVVEAIDDYRQYAAFAKFRILQLVDRNASNRRGEPHK